MILYSKFGEFIGIGKEELTMLGFDDMDDFTSYHNDFADLFVNRPGYIFKFKNFSWIDYALHSGAPRKSAILQLKNGNQVELNLRIREVFLLNPIKEQDIFYSVEISTQVFGQVPSQIPTTININQEAPKNADTHEEIEETPSFMPSEEPAQELESSPAEKSEVNFIQDYAPAAEDKETQEDFSKEETQSFEAPDEPGLRLKVDDDVFASNKEEETKHQEDAYIQDYEDEAPPSINFDQGPESKPQIDIEEPSVFQEDFEPQKLEEQEAQLDFDLSDSAQELDLDIGLIAEIITDYIDKIETNIPLLYTYIENNQNKELQNTLYELKGIADSLHVKDFSAQLNKILAGQDQVEQKEQLHVFEKLFSQFKEKLA